MSKYPVHYSEDGTMAWSCVDADEIIEYHRPAGQPEPPEKYCFKGVLEGPRWACIEGFLRELAFLHDLELKTETWRGWLREKVLFNFEGKYEDVKYVINVIDDIIKGHQT